ncbi:hypothetical protein SAMN05444005_101193 [Flavobacterium urocaniciphilum]|uniref:Uncharacterized protein n=1 Tax=Flavobacterium urocaniciphilum TaxID=1299341 RepID=A0A1H8YT90_9FLAO|nr:hypothetical protein SAMN05444005_101193 [Flavobacterium urocaniciphilum]
MKYKYIIALFLIGIVFWLIGNLIKLMHWPFSVEANILSILFMLLSCIILIVKILKNNNDGSKLNL